MSKAIAELKQIIRSEGAYYNPIGLQLGTMIDDKKVLIGNITLDETEYEILETINFTIDNHICDGSTLKHTINEIVLEKGNDVLMYKIKATGLKQYILLGKLR